MEAKLHWKKPEVTCLWSYLKESKIWYCAEKKEKSFKNDIKEEH